MALLYSFLDYLKVYLYQLQLPISFKLVTNNEFKAKFLTYLCGKGQKEKAVAQPCHAMLCISHIGHRKICKSPASPLVVTCEPLASCVHDLQVLASHLCYL